MKKIELLSPVGDFESLKAAVQNGADSVYFGASNFNARASATNFNLTDLKEAITYAKLRGVKTHLTLNTLIKNEEFEEAVLLASKSYEFGIDAIIVQDLGLASTLIKNFPDLSIHASTQMTIHNLEGVLEAQKLGFKRVVLSRELSLDEITYICNNSDVEIETFIHGALCISYSGQCLFSSMVGGRSGNRGKCAQPCRLPYKLISSENDEHKCTINNDSYLLSPRDLCGLEFIPDLINAGVMCFKIEGRMKTPSYVATVTRIYRKYIDLALSGKPYVIDDRDKKELMQVFNRGGFSCGHLSNNPNKNLIYNEKPNHMGIYIGNVSNLKPGKGHVFFNLKDSVAIGDTIQFEKENTKYTVSELMVKGKNINFIDKKDLVEIGRMKGNISIGDKIYKIVSKELSNKSKLSYVEENKKVKLSTNINIKKGKPISITVKTLDNDDIWNNINITKKSNIIPVEALSKPIDKERIIAQITKTKDTIFEFEEINIDLEENTFISSISNLNELRRNCLEEIYNIGISRVTRKGKNIKLNLSSTKTKVSNIRKTSVLLNILNKDMDYTKLKNVDNLYIPLKYFYNKKYEKQLLRISESFNTYIYLPNIIKANYRNILMNVIENSIHKYHIKGFVLSNLSSYIFMNKIKEKYEDKFEYIANYTLNVFNSYTEKTLSKLGVKKITISPELNSLSIDSITENKYCENELIVYGKVPLMTSNYCLLGKTNKCYPTCGLKCKEDVKYYLKDRLGFNFRVIPDNIQTITTIYNSKTTSISGTNFNVDSYRIDILDESIDEINNIILTALAGGRLEGKEYTNGNLNREI